MGKEGGLDGVGWELWGSVLVWRELEEVGGAGFGLLCSGMWCSSAVGDLCTH